MPPRDFNDGNNNDINGFDFNAPPAEEPTGEQLTSEEKVRRVHDVTHGIGRFYSIVFGLQWFNTHHLAEWSSFPACVILGALQCYRVLFNVEGCQQDMLQQMYEILIECHTITKGLVSDIDNECSRLKEFLADLKPQKDIDYANLTNKEILVQLEMYYKAMLPHVPGFDESIHLQKKM